MCGSGTSLCRPAHLACRALRRSWLRLGVTGGSHRPGAQKQGRAKTSAGGDSPHMTSVSTRLTMQKMTERLSNSTKATKPWGRPRGRGREPPVAGLKQPIWPAVWQGDVSAGGISSTRWSQAHSSTLLQRDPRIFLIIYKKQLFCVWEKARWPPKPFGVCQSL